MQRGPVLVDGWLLAREEAQIERLAARALIPLAALGEALAWAHDPEEAAAVLGVFLYVAAKPAPSPEG